MEDKEKNQSYLYNAIMENENFISQFVIATKARLFNARDFVRTVWKYWRNFSFAKIDAKLLCSYFWKSPYAIGREETGEFYGETPLVTMDKIAKEAGILPGDVVYELGCGRGRSCFWLACFRGCRVVGVEYNRVFVEKARKIECPRVQFVEGDYLQTDLREATVVYLYGTLLGEREIFELCQSLKKVKKGTRVVSISYPLQEYCGEPLFRVVREFEVEFQWGRTEAYLQERI